jgi:hypothetical protein
MMVEIHRKKTILTGQVKGLVKEKVKIKKSKVKSTKITNL